MTPAVGLLLAGCVLASVWLTGRVRRYALKHALLDLPNQRGSHTVPTPRGGGVGFVVTTIAGLLWWTPLTGLPSPPVVVLAAAVAVAGIGFVDDHGHVSPIARLLAQFAAGTVGILALARADAGGLAAAPAWLPAPVVLAIAVVAIVWFVNLTNFMDGIDGIAGAEVVFVCAGGVLLEISAGADRGAWSALVLGAAIVGFLVWNWPPARIFMGDAGSGFAGFMLAAYIWAAWLRAPQDGAAWLILAGVFVVDATVTLADRARRRERLFDAHRAHAYQRLARLAGGHRPVTIGSLMVNVCWLWPIAWLVVTARVRPLVGLAAAWLPMATAIVIIARRTRRS